MPDTENRLTKGGNHIHLEKIDVPGIPGLRLWGNRLYANKHVLVTSTFGDGVHGDENYVFNSDGILVHTDLNGIVESIEVHLFKDVETGISSVVISKIEDGDIDRPYGVIRTYNEEGLLMTSEGAYIELDENSVEPPKKLTDWYHENTYDIETNRLVSTMRLCGPDGVGTRTYYDYDEEGRLIAERLYDMKDFKDGEALQLTGYKYAIDGSYILECIDAMDGELLCTEFYDSDGNAIEFNSSAEKSSADYVVINGRTLMQHMVTESEGHLQETTFEFDEFGNVSVMTDEYKYPDSEGNEFVAYLRTTYERDENHNIITAEDSNGEHITVTYTVTPIEDMIEELDMEESLVLN